MHEYTAHLCWQRAGQTFVDHRYSRLHLIDFDGGASLRASSSPQVVRTPMSDPSAVDPEEMFVASLSSCHMLWFLSLAAAQGYCIDRYEDRAVGTMARDADGRMAITRVVLRPQVDCSGARLPTQAELRALHDQAHAACFIAQSVRSEVVCEPRFGAATG